MHNTLKPLFILALYFLVISNIFLQYEIHNYIGILFLGIFLGMLLLIISCRYHVHNGLLVFATVIGVYIGIKSLFLAHIFESYNTIFILGFIQGLILVPLYKAIGLKHSKTFSILYTITLVAFVVAINLFLIDLPNNSVLFFNACLITLLLIGVYYLFSDFKYKSVWLFFLFCRWLISLRYKVIYEGVEHTKSQKGIILISNHISWLDWLLLQFPIEPRVHYIINKKVYNKPFFHTLIALNDCIPISRKASKDSFTTAKKLLKENKIIAIFPEGGITKNGEIGKFYSGFRLLQEDDKITIVPVCINGLWGSRFSYSKKKFTSEKQGFRRVIRINYGEALSADSDEVKVKHAIQIMKDK